MKSGVVQIAAVYINCPTCGEGFANTADGSMIISMHNFKPDQIGKVVECFACGERYRIPRTARKVFA